MAKFVSPPIQASILKGRTESTINVLGFYLQFGTDVQLVKTFAQTLVSQFAMFSDNEAFKTGAEFYKKLSQDLKDKKRKEKIKVAYRKGLPPMRRSNKSDGSLSVRPESIKMPRPP